MVDFFTVIISLIALSIFQGYLYIFFSSSIFSYTTSEMLFGFMIPNTVIGFGGVIMYLVGVLIFYFLSKLLKFPETQILKAIRAFATYIILSAISSILIAVLIGFFGISSLIGSVSGMEMVGGLLFILGLIVLFFIVFLVILISGPLISTISFYISYKPPILKAIIAGLIFSITFFFVISIPTIVFSIASSPYHESITYDETLQRCEYDTRKDECFIMAAWKLKNYSICEHVVNLPGKNSCLQSFLDKTNDRELCGLFQDEQNPRDPWYKTARENCLSEMALKHNDIESCYRLETRRDNCILRFALKDLDPRICDQIELQEHKRTCFEKIAVSLRNIHLCRWIKSEYERGICGQTVSRYIKTLDECEKVSDDINQKNCISAVEKRSKIETNSEPASCKKFIDDRYEYEKCMVPIAVDLEDENLCEDPIFSVISKAKCYLALMRKKKDPKICGLMPDDLDKYDIEYEKRTCDAIANLDSKMCEPLFSYEKTDCMRIIANLTNNLSICAEIRETGYSSSMDTVETCYSDIAINTKDSSVCDKLKENQTDFAGIDMRDRCLKELGELIGKADICQKIVKNGYRNQCLWELATKLKKPELCDMLDWTKEIDECKGLNR